MGSGQTGLEAAEPCGQQNPSSRVHEIYIGGSSSTLSCWSGSVMIVSLVITDIDGTGWFMALGPIFVTTAW